MMSDRAKRKGTQRMKKSSPVGSAHGLPAGAPEWFRTLLQFKGFGGGVPPNTETAAVNPRAGIAEITRRCLFFIEMAWAGSATTLPALLISRLSFNSRMASRHGAGPGAIPGNRTNLS
jgi:hypothetical protein